MQLVFARYLTVTNLKSLLSDPKRHCSPLLCTGSVMFTMSATCTHLLKLVRVTLVRVRTVNPKGVRVINAAAAAAAAARVGAASYAGFSRPVHLVFIAFLRTGFATLGLGCMITLHARLPPVRRSSLSVAPLATPKRTLPAPLTTPKCTLPAHACHKTLRGNTPAGKPIFNIEYDPEAFQDACRSQKTSGMKSIFKVEWTAAQLHHSHSLV